MNEKLKQEVIKHFCINDFDGWIKILVIDAVEFGYRKGYEAAKQAFDKLILEVCEGCVKPDYLEDRIRRLDKPEKE